MPTVSNPLTQSDEQHRRELWSGLIALANLVLEPEVAVPDRVVVHLDKPMTPEQLQAHAEAADADESTTGAVDIAVWTSGPVSFMVCAPRRVIA